MSRLFDLQKRWKHWTFWYLVGVPLVVVGMMAFLDSAYLSYRFHQSLPSEPVPSKGRTYQDDEHGKFVYLDRAEHLWLVTLRFGGWMLAMAGSLALRYSHRLKTRLAPALLLAALVFPAAAQTSAPPTQASGPAPAPLPALLTTAHKLFLGNAGDQDNADCLRAYSDLYAALSGAGRYQLVADPSNADLVLELHYEFSLGAGVNGASSNTPRQFRVLLLDPKTHVVLWAIVERTNYAALERNRNKNLDEVVTVLATDLNDLLSAKPPANKSSIHHGLFQ